MKRIALTTLVLCLHAQAQDPATLTGVILDPSGVAVPGAPLRLIELRRDIPRATETDGEGYYRFSSLEPGEYSLEVTQAGFRKTELRSLLLKARDRQHLRIVMPDHRTYAVARHYWQGGSARNRSFVRRRGGTIQHEDDAAVRQVDRHVAAVCAGRGERGRGARRRTSARGARRPEGRPRVRGRSRFSSRRPPVPAERRPLIRAPLRDARPAARSEGMAISSNARPVGGRESRRRSRERPPGWRS